MYTKLRYDTTGWTAINLLADIVAVMTGETNKANLSGDINQTDSFIDTTSTLAGWTLWDDISSTNKVIRAPIADDATKYKYAWLSTSGVRITVRLYGDWDNVLHTGTDWASQSGTSFFTDESVNTETHQVHISASARHFAVFTKHSNELSNGTIQGIFEHTRNSPSDTVANAYIPAVINNGTGALSANIGGSSSNNFFSPRYLDCRAATPADVTGLNATGWMFTPLGGTWGKTTTAKTVIADLFGTVAREWQICDSSKIKVHPLFSFGVNNPLRLWLGGDISALADIYMTSYNFGDALDELVFNSNTYVIWSNSTMRYAVRKG